jgi:hypothetical protein
MLYPTVPLLAKLRLVSFIALKLHEFSNEKKIYIVVSAAFSIIAIMLKSF